MIIPLPYYFRGGGCFSQITFGNRPIGGGGGESPTLDRIFDIEFDSEFE
jgi:hypothetical protein